MTNRTSPDKRLEQTRRLIASIQEQLKHIYVAAPSLKSDNRLEEQLFQTNAVLAQAADQLAQPALRMAMIGTTSAGKSTLVNGLVGRQIAPMDAAELSAGVLHLVHQDRRRFKIDPVEGVCAAEDRQDQPDPVVYERIREHIFKPYHEARKKRTVAIPEIRIEGPLLPANWPELLALPEQVGVELFDLPGLNSVNDRDNLKVIQSYLQQCFSIVVMDYSHTDTDSRETLLEEVQQVVQALGGKTEAMLFVLNRVDRRNETDDPLEDRISECAQAIQAKLKLPEPPAIIPVSAQPLFYAQCAWGWARLDAEHQLVIDKQQQKRYLQQFLNDCGKFIKTHQKRNPAVKRWLRDVEDALEDSQDNPEGIDDALITQERLQAWVTWVWECSKALDLWQALKDRITVHFTGIVIDPVLIKPLAHMDSLLTSLSDYSQTQRLATKEAVEQQKRTLEEQFHQLKETLDAIKKTFEQDTGDAVQAMTTAMASSDEEQIANAVKQILGDGANGQSTDEAFRTIVRDVKNDLIDHLIQPVRNYYKEGWISDELKKRLNDCLPPEEAQKIARAAENYRTAGMVNEAIESGMAMRVRKNDSQELDKLKNKEQRARHLYQRMREGFATRAAYQLQVKETVIQDVLEQVMAGHINRIESQIHQAVPDQAERLMTIYREKRLESQRAAVSVDLFDLPNIVGQHKTVQEKTGTETVTVEEGSCFTSERSEERDVIGDVAYAELTLPSIHDMTAQWVDGLNQVEHELWQVIAKQFEALAHEQFELFEKSASEARKRLLDLLNHRLDQNEAEYRETIREMDDLDKLRYKIHQYYTGLKNNDGPVLPPQPSQAKNEKTEATMA